jgi:integrase
VYADKVKLRLATAYRPSTRANHTLAVKTLAAFCILFSVQFPVVSTITLLTYIEFLVDNGLAPATIKNYLSAVQTTFRRLSIDITGFQSNLIKLSLRSLEINTPTAYKPKPIVSLQELCMLLTVMQGHPLFKFFRVAILFGFFGMLRISNVTSSSIKYFDKSRHLCRGDVTHLDSAISIALKWSKTYQQASVVNLPLIPSSLLCPVQAYNTLITTFPLQPNQPLLAYSVSNKLIIFSKSTLQNMLKIAVKKANLHPQITFHSLRRSSASLLPKFFKSTVLSTTTAMLGSG